MPLQFHSRSHKDLLCFIAPLPNVTCLQYWDMIRDEATKYWNIACSPLLPVPTKTFRMCWKLPELWTKTTLIYSGLSWTSLCRYFLCIFGVDVRFLFFFFFSLEDIKVTLNHQEAPHICSFYKSYFHDKLITLPLTAAQSEGSKGLRGDGP